MGVGKLALFVLGGGLSPCLVAGLWVVLVSPPDLRPWVRRPMARITSRQ